MLAISQRHSTPLHARPTAPSPALLRCEEWKAAATCNRLQRADMACEVGSDLRTCWTPLPPSIQRLQRNAMVHSTAPRALHRLMGSAAMLGPLCSASTLRLQISRTVRAYDAFAVAFVVATVLSILFSPPSPMSAAAAVSADVITLQSLTIDPATPAPIEAPLRLQFAFESTRDLPDAFWDFKYVVDSASKRHVIEMGKTPSTKYIAGKNTFDFAAPGIDVSGVKQSVLLNVGLLTCTLFNGAEQVVEIKIMTQVSKGKDGQLKRLMFDPLA